MGRLKRMGNLLLSTLLCCSMTITTFAEEKTTVVTYTGTGVEQYEVTVPASLTPGTAGSIEVGGTWSSRKKLTVTAPETVTLTCDLDGNTETLDVEFGDIILNGSNTESLSASVPISIEEMKTNNLFGTWTGNLVYSVNLVETGEHIHSYSETSRIPATCTATGSITKTCSCGDTKTETLEKIPHDYEDGKCKDCQEPQPETPEHTHNYVETNRVEATCTTEGSVTKTCSCGDTKTETLEKLSHTYEDFKCEDCGGVDPEHTHTYENDKCTGCGDLDPNHTHTYENYKCSCGAIDPDHTHTYENYKCTGCGAIDPDHTHTYENDKCTGCGDLDPSHIHNYSETNRVEATCTTEGSVTSTCTCGDVKIETLSATGHIWDDDFTVDVEATCEADGSKSVHCGGCDETKYSTTIPATGHNYQDGTCTNCGEADQDYVVYTDFEFSKSNYTQAGLLSLNGDVVIPETFEYSGTNYKVTSIASETFKGNTALTSIVIPGSVVSINSSAFEGCTNLTGVIMKNGVEGIGYRTFSGCTRLESIAIPGSVTNIVHEAFDNTPWLSARQAENPLVIVGNGILIDGKAVTGDVVIPDGVVNIAAKAFLDNTKLTSITIHDSVVSIGFYAFGGCSGLTNVEIPDSVTSIGDGAFSKCTGLTSVEIPDSVTSIGSSVFYTCKSLNNVEIPDSVTSIGSSAFNGCTGLTTIYYTGSEEQWNAITKGSIWKYNCPSDMQIIYNYTK